MKEGKNVGMWDCTIENYMYVQLLELNYVQLLELNNLLDLWMESVASC